ncbi:MAG TPA: M20/M25/M40 family metallo-hydrolase [Pyrinomonadaceae bacterium]|nr:M20/M25/M40 family metallo-hydrolase [Pyrinomonadaceae bacterium]
MRRLLFSLFLTSLLVLNSSALNYSVNAQRRQPRAQRTAASLPAQRGADKITANQLRDYLTFISSDALEGRDTPSRGLDTAAQFLAVHLSRWGFKPAGDAGSYFQKIALTSDVVDKEQTKVSLNNQPLTLGEHYLPFPGTLDANGPMVFAGNGWFVKSKNIDGYRGIDARGKIAIIFGPPAGLPRGITRQDLQGTRGVDYMNAFEYAEKQGVAALVIVPDFQFIANWERNRMRMIERGNLVVEKFQTGPQRVIAGIIASPQLANTLFQGERANATALFESAYGGQEVEPFALRPDKKLSIAVRKQSSAATSTQNVVAVFEGSDPILKNEYVALGAHYDHVGVGIPVNGDATYNGADDDGSGTTALLAIAEALAHTNPRPKRSILFVWHAGEEKGLWGSRYFTEYPTVALDKIVTQINLDMIGRSKQEGDTNPRNTNLSGPNGVYVIGSKMMSTELGELTETVNRGYLNLNYDYRYDDPADPNRYFFRSDHINYARKGIPIVFFFDGEHVDYHRPSDSVEKIDFQKMEKITRTIHMTMWEIAERATRPAVDKQLPPGVAR